MPGTVVMKFGGTSVADAERIKRAARRIVAAHEQNQRVVAVLSARGKTTIIRMAAMHQPARAAASSLDVPGLRVVMVRSQLTRPRGNRLRVNVRCGLQQRPASAGLLGPP